MLMINIDLDPRMLIFICFFLMFQNLLLSILFILFIFNIYYYGSRPLGSEYFIRKLAANRILQISK